MKLASGDALKEQLKARITQEVASILPRLHGLSQLLKEGQDSLNEVLEVAELRTLINTMNMTLSDNTAPAESNIATSMSTSVVSYNK